jgi:hypothetical protein
MSTGSRTAHGRRRRRPCVRRAGRRRVARECRVDQKESAAVSPLLARERRRDRSCPGGFGVIATLLVRTPGTRSPWNPVRLTRTEILVSRPPSNSEEAAHGPRRSRGDASNGRWHRSHARQQTLSVRRDIRREIKTIALHLKVALLSRGSTGFADPRIPARPDLQALRPWSGRSRQDPGFSIAVGTTVAGGPPAQIPACTASALGSSLGCWRRISPRGRDASRGRAVAIGSRGGSCVPSPGLSAGCGA